MANVLIKSSLRFVVPVCRTALRAGTSRSLTTGTNSNMMQNQKLLVLGSAYKPFSLGSHRYSTEAEEELNTFLIKEIALESKEQAKHKAVTEIEGFTVNTDGPDVTLTKVDGSDRIVVTFDINNSIAMESPLADTTEQGTDAIQDTVSKPPFLVEITNATNKTLSLHCSFPPTEDYMDMEPDAQDTVQSDTQQQQPEQDGMYDLFEIDEVSIHEGDITEGTYSHHSAVMDGDLYEILMDMLDERGITSDFIQQMTEFSTKFEHNKYVTFLEELQSFVNPKK